VPSEKGETFRFTRIWQDTRKRQKCQASTAEKEASALRREFNDFEEN
jgi:hypothetical protein